jgi:hypothetical protein
MDVDTVYSMQHVLRFTAHLVIIMRQLRILPVQDIAGDKIIKCYVDLLIGAKKVNIMYLLYDNTN